MDNQPLNTSPQDSQPAFQFAKASALLSQAEKIYQERFGSLLLITLITVLISGLGGFVLGLTNQLAKVPGAPATATPLGIILAVLLFLLIICVSVWTFGATLRCIMNEPGQSSAGASLRLARSDIWPLLTTGILAFLAILGGTILLIVPGVILSFWYSQAAYVVITERLSGREALRRSKFYVKNNVWQLFKKGFYLLLITVVLTILVSLAFMVLDKVLQTKFLSEIALFIFRLLWTPLATIYSYLVYQQLRQSKA
ncbi:MAG TPA: hypothetical protein VHA30_00490 [Patescibacteria group bacterium]|nr:hypothetical protein [Patescibacteria group bacterium]